MSSPTPQPRPPAAPRAAAPREPPPHEPPPEPPEALSSKETVTTRQPQLRSRRRLKAAEPLRPHSTCSRAYGCLARPDSAADRGGGFPWVSFFVFCFGVCVCVVVFLGGVAFSWVFLGSCVCGARFLCNPKRVLQNPPFGGGVASF